MERPKTVVDVSTPETSTRTRGRRRYFEKAVEFSWMVTWSVEPELKNSGTADTSQCMRASCAKR